MQNITIDKPLPRMRTVNETAKELHLPVYALRQWIKAGDLPAIYCGKKALLNLDRVIDFLNGERERNE